MKFPYLKEHYTLNEKDELINPKEINSFYKADPLLFTLRCQIEKQKTTKEEFNFLIEHSDCKCTLNDGYGLNAFIFALNYNKVLKLNKEQIYKIYEKSNKSYISKYDANALEFIIKYNTFNFTKNEIIKFLEDESFYSEEFKKEDAYCLLLFYNKENNFDINNKYLKNLVLKLDPSKNYKDNWNSFLLLMLYDDFLGFTTKELIGIYKNIKLDKYQLDFVKNNVLTIKNYNNFLKIKKAFLEKEEITESINVLNKQANKKIIKI